MKASVASDLQVFEAVTAVAWDVICKGVKEVQFWGEQEACNKIECFCVCFAGE